MEDDEAGGWNNDPFRGSLGLLPSGPDPVGEWIVHHQPPAPHIVNPAPECKAKAIMGLGPQSGKTIRLQRSGSRNSLPSK